MKNSLKFLVKEFLMGGHILSLGGASVAIIYMLVLGVEINYQIAISIYLFGQPIFIIDRYLHVEEDESENKDRTEHIRTYSRFIPIIVALYIITFIILMLLSGLYIGLALGLAFFVIGGFYGGVFKPLTKKIIAFKNLFVALFWSSFGIYVVLQYDNISTSPEFWLLFLYLFLRTLVMQVFFDIKDYQTDKEFGLKTIPAIFGKKTAFSIMTLISLFSIFALLIGLWITGDFQLYLALLVSSTIGGVLLFFASRKYKRIYLLAMQFEYIFSIIIIVLFKWIL